MKNFLIATLLLVIATTKGTKISEESVSVESTTINFSLPNVTESLQEALTTPANDNSSVPETVLLSSELSVKATEPTVEEEQSDETTEVPESSEPTKEDETTEAHPSSTSSVYSNSSLEKLSA